MIKAKMNNGDLVFGLSEENIKRLKLNQPIKFNLKDMGLEDRSVIIAYGTSEDDLYGQMIDFIDLENTKIHL